jgi:RNA polymerase sigma factor (sigma-70 family)
MAGMGSTQTNHQSNHLDDTNAATTDERPAIDPVRDLPEVIDVYSRTVKAAARKVLGSSVDVEDIVQETWMTFLAHGHKINDPRCLGSWLYRVATNASYRAARKRGRYTLGGDELFNMLPAETTDAATIMHSRDQRSALRDALDCLSDADRELAELLVDPQDLPYKEISQRCGRPMGSLGPTRERLIRKLRATPSMQRLMDAATDEAGLTLAAV